jgi:lipopolysaccharide transport system ATP-binding protein
MSDVVIEIANLGKKYRLGQDSRPYKTLRESMSGAATAPYRRIARLAGRRPAEGLRGYRPEFWALKDVSFEVRRGEVLGIIGRNGAGKSTLLKLLSQITEPTEGRFRVKGGIASLLEVGTGFHPELSGRENIFLNGAILGMRRTEIARRFDEIVAFAEVDSFIDTPVKHFSSGMYLRLAFAVAAHMRSEILLVDEVLAVGDVGFQKKCLASMSELSSEGRTVLFVSHNMNAIDRLCARVVTMDQGKAISIRSDVSAAISDYIAGVEGADEISEWINPGGMYDNPWFRPEKLWITDESDTVISGPTKNDAPLRVHICGEVRREDTALKIGYAIYNEDGVPLYWSQQTDGRPDSWPVLQRGTCHLKSAIPARLLNEGSYRIELLSSLHCRQWITEPGVTSPSVHLRIQGVLSDSPYWVAKRPGLLAPVLDWEASQS